MQQAICAAVYVGAGQHMVAALQQHGHTMRGGHARGKGQRLRPAF